MTTTLRSELEELPNRMKYLPVDERGYPVPWFVDWADGKPEFRAMNPRKWIHAVRFKRCWVCGEALGRYLCFVAGPMCGISRTTSEPPTHLDCGRWSARNCPFLNNPDAIRRVDETVSAATEENSAGFALMRNPGVTMLYIAKDYSLFDDGKGKPLIHMGELDSIEWYAEGRNATRAEVMHSIESGFPALFSLAMQQDGAVKVLNEQREHFQKHLPQE